MNILKKIKDWFYEDTEPLLPSLEPWGYNAEEGYYEYDYDEDQS